MRRSFGLLASGIAIQIERTSERSHRTVLREGRLRIWQIFFHGLAMSGPLRDYYGRCRRQSAGRWLCWNRSRLRKICHRR